MPQRYAISFKKAKILPKTCHSFFGLLFARLSHNRQKKAKKVQNSFRFGIFLQKKHQKV
jgi:hypothetical protein